MDEFQQTECNYKENQLSESVDTVKRVEKVQTRDVPITFFCPRVRVI